MDEGFSCDILQLPTSPVNKLLTIPQPLRLLNADEALREVITFGTRLRDGSQNYERLFWDSESLRRKEIAIHTLLQAFQLKQAPTDGTRDYVRQKLIAEVEYAAELHGNMAKSLADIQKQFDGDPYKERRIDLLKFNRGMKTFIQSMKDNFSVDGIDRQYQFRCTKISHELDRAWIVLFNNPNDPTRGTPEDFDE